MGANGEMEWMVISVYGGLPRRRPREHSKGTLGDIAPSVVQTSGQTRHDDIPFARATRR